MMRYWRHAGHTCPMLAGRKAEIREAQGCCYLHQQPADQTLARAIRIASPLRQLEDCTLSERSCSK